MMRRLNKNPDNFRIKMGKFNTLKELRRWEDARELLNEMDTATPEFSGHGRTRKYNADQLDLDIARGWFLVQRKSAGRS